MESRTGGARLPRWETWLFHGMVAAAFLLGLNLALFTAHSAERSSNGYVAYFVAAQLLRDGERVRNFYDDDWFAARIAERGPAIYDIFAPNPPTMALLLLPLAGLDPSSARALWTILNLVTYLGFLAWVSKTLHLPRLWAVAFLLLALAYQPVYASLGQEQVSLTRSPCSPSRWRGSGYPAGRRRARSCCWERRQRFWPLTCPICPVDGPTAPGCCWPTPGCTVPCCYGD